MEEVRIQNKCIEFKALNFFPIFLTVTLAIVKKAHTFATAIETRSGSSVG